ncbi:hypothetical protein HDU93_007026 [Gonapodya sp. JEL0774]|nr:hypothetical protein HDU93_007026 [Gonapodya sp. JEL0774]
MAYALQFGQTILYNATYSSLSTTDMTSRNQSLTQIETHLLNIRESGARILLVISLGQDDGNEIIKAIARLRIDFEGVFSTVTPTFETFTSEPPIGVGKYNAEYISAPSQWHPSLNYFDSIFGSTSKYVELITAYTGKTPGYITASASAAGLLLQKAIQSANSFAQSDVNVAMSQLREETFFGPVAMSREQRNVGHTGVLIQWQDSKMVSVLPEAYSSSLYRPPPTFDARDGCPIPGTLITSDGMQCNLSRSISPTSWEGILLMSLVYALAFIGAVGVVLVLVLYFKRAPLLRSMGPVYVFAIIFGSLFELAGAIFYVGDPTPAICKSQTSLSLLGLSLMTGAIFGRMYQVYCIYDNPKLWKSNTKSEGYVIRIICQAVGVEVVRTPYFKINFPI